MSAAGRLFASAGAIALWLVLLFLGCVFHGAVHLLLAAALVLFPWRADAVAAKR